MRIILVIAAIILLSSAEVVPTNTLTAKKYLLGKVNPAKDSNFVKIPKAYTHKSNIYLEKETMKAFARMQEAARKEGISLNIISAFRSFDYQKMLWQAKWTGQRSVNGVNLKNKYPDKALRAKEILKYSAMPGTSRHHWGTDIDIYSLNNKKFESGTGLKIYNWLVENASKFGFCQVYSKKGKERLFGYEEEKWHWSYMPKSRIYLTDYANTIKYSDLVGFGGDSVAEQLEVVPNYVMAICSDCN